MLGMGSKLSKAKCSQDGNITLAFLGVLGAQHKGEIIYGYITLTSQAGGGGLRRLPVMFKYPLPPRRLTAVNGEKLKNGYCTPAILGAQS